MWAFWLKILRLLIILVNISQKSKTIFGNCNRLSRINMKNSIKQKAQDKQCSCATILAHIIYFQQFTLWEYNISFINSESWRAYIIPFSSIVGECIPLSGDTLMYLFKSSTVKVIKIHCRQLNWITAIIFPQDQIRNMSILIMLIM